MSYGGQQQYGAPPGAPPGGGGYGAPPPQHHGGGGYGPPPGAPPGRGMPSPFISLPLLTDTGGGYGGAPPPGGPPAYGGAGGGYGAPPPAAPPAAAATAAASRPPARGGPRLMPIPSALWNWFSSVDTDRSGSISATELERALINGDWTPFDLDTVKLLMGIFDTDRSGTIGFNEFAGLWKYIQDWQGVFRHFDRDRSGTIDGAELRDALARFGFNLSPRLVGLVERKYVLTQASAAGPPSALAPGQQAGISFDRFVRACVVVKQLSEAFQRLDTDRDGWVQVGYEGFMEVVLGLP
ncbi:hypothetical protein B0H11DRAFT_2043920 [Mycena galericulata]|nr:hypothetical protein B0H11DRAFT_2043920 [Mycena galericulata]